MRKILVDVSSHGYGHAAQTLPVLAALYASDPSLQLIIRSRLPLEFWRARLAIPFKLICATSDFGMAMTSALDVDVAASFQRYSDFHQEWPEKVRVATAQLIEIQPDVLLSNVSYLPLAAATAVGIPAFAFCSLNWAEMFRFSCMAFSGSERIYDQIQTAYQGANAFLQPMPCMPMPKLSNTVSVGPIARVARVNMRSALMAKMGLANDTSIKLVLCSFGGFDHDFDTRAWPVLPSSVRILTRAPKFLPTSAHPNVVFIEPLAMEFFDVLCACDAVITKPGYGMSVESACNGIPMLYVRRGGWPEEDAIVAWMRAHNRVAEISRSTVDAGLFMPALEQIWAMPSPKIPNATGAIEIARLVLS